MCLSASAPVPFLRAAGAAELVHGVIVLRSLSFLLLLLPVLSNHAQASHAALFHGGYL